MILSDKPRFGPGGNSEAFNAIYKGKTLLAPKWVADIGLDAYEYEAGQGISAGPEMLSAIGKEAAKAGIYLSFHAPYFISLSSVEAQKRLNSVEYIQRSLDAAAYLGADTIVVHTGSAGKISREQAMAYAAETLSILLDSAEFHGIKVGLETMGKKNQLGTLDEVLRLCKLDKTRLVPVVDFGHLNARDCGGVFKNTDDYKRVFDAIATEHSDEAARYLHCHFSRIEYTDGGEKRHKNFEDREWGPDFEPLMEVLAKEKLAPTIICESAGNQARDALAMKEYYNSL